MRNLSFKVKKNPIKRLVALLLTGIIVFTGLPMLLQAEGSYETNFQWNNIEEDLNEWPLEPGLTKTYLGIGTAGFAYSRYYYNDAGRIVLEFDISIFPDAANQETSAYRTFRDQWKYANIFIDPQLASKVDDAASFFMMSYPADKKTESLSKATKTGANVYKLNVMDVFPKMPTGSDYMKSKLYLVLQSWVTRNHLDEDYAVELRYTNNENQIYEQRGSSGLQVLGSYYGHTPAISPDFDASKNNDDVTLKTIAPFQTASMPGIIPNPILPPDMMRTVGQSVIYDNINGKLVVYYKVAPNHYIYSRPTDTYKYADNGYFLSSWIGIRQVMDSRIYAALKPDENGVVGQMKMFDTNGRGMGWNVATNIRANEFSYTPVTSTVGTYSYMMVPAGFKTSIANKATVPPAHTNNVKNVYLHGHRKEGDYVRFVYNVDKNMMDALFANDINSSTLSISTSYITDRPTQITDIQNVTTPINQTEYRWVANQGIVIPKGAYIIFDLPKDSRSVFKVGLENNYERIIGDMYTKYHVSVMRHSNVDPTDFGAPYTTTPYSATSGGFVLTSETGLIIPMGETIILNMFDDTSPDTVRMTIADNIYGIGGVQYTLEKYLVNQDNLYTMPNAHVRSGIIINRSANTPHVDEFFTDSTAINGHSKYPNALVSMRKAIDGTLLREALSYTTPKVFTVGGADLTGYDFTFDVPAGIQLKKDMDLSFANAADGYFRSAPSTYRTQARVTFDQNGGDGAAVDRIVPINEKSYGEIGYAANGFTGDNILWLDSAGNAVPPSTAVKYLSDYEGYPITDTSSADYLNRQFYSGTPTRSGYRFLGWSTKQVDSMGSAAFNSMPTLTDAAGWDENVNYKFVSDSPVDQSRTVYAVWERDLYQYNIVFHNNNGGTEFTHTLELPLAVVEAGTGKLTDYLGEAGNILYDKDFKKTGCYFVGWSETATVGDMTQVHELYTNASKVQLSGQNFQLQLNEEPADQVTHVNPWKTVPAVNDNGIATINLYAQYKPLLEMRAEIEWFDKGQKAIYESDPVAYNGQPLNPAPFGNSNVAMVLLRTTEGKTLDPAKYEIVQGFYKTINDTQAEWVWTAQEGHDANGRKYSYLMTEFNALLYPDELEIINHFNTHKTWASVYINMIGQSDNLSKWTSISFADGADTRSFMAVATSNQPDAMNKQFVNSTENYKFKLRNFEVDILPANIHRIQANHTQIVIDSPPDASYLYLRLNDGTTEGGTLVKFYKDSNVWKLHHENPTPGFQINEVDDGTGKKQLIISSSVPGNPLNLENRVGERVYALFTSTNADQELKNYSSREIKPYNPLDQLVDVRQEPHIKDINGDITHNVVSAGIPAGSYAGAEYTLGYMSGLNFVALKDSGNDIKVTPDALGKLTFNVPAGMLDGTGNTQYVIRGVDPLDMFKPTNFNGPAIDLTAPTINANNFEVLTGNPIADADGILSTDDSNATLRYTITKGGLPAALPEGIAFDPATGKFSGKTADTIPAEQCGAYNIAITAEDIYGNVSTRNITFTINQKPTTPDIESITQSANDSNGNAVITVKGQTGAAVKLYSEIGGAFTEIDIAGISGKSITNSDGTMEITLTQADIMRFNDAKVYVTQQKVNELESGKVDSTEAISRKDSEKIATGGAVVIDNKPPTPLMAVAPEAGTDTLKITNLSADQNLPDIKDVHKITLKIGTNAPCTLERQYDAVSGEPTGKWICSNHGNEFTETEEMATVIVNPTTGETQTKKVGVLNYKLPGTLTFEEYQVITATYYDYLGNATAPFITTVPKLPEPIAPYNLTGFNNIRSYPGKTRIMGKADPGAVVSTTLGFRTYKATVNELGEFILEIPIQPEGAEITLTSMLNGYTREAKVTVKEDPLYGVTGEPGTSKTPRTGDFGLAFEWIGLAVALSGIAYLIIRRKRKLPEK
ncbi:MAG: hypothetical protein GX222_01430 [Ruminococcaceae bacterium]|nr:hypothetical protein [Oscillospiraceae bacterium]